MISRVFFIINYGDPVFLFLQYLVGYRKEDADVMSVLTRLCPNFPFMRQKASSVVHFRTENACMLLIGSMPTPTSLLGMGI